MSNYRATINNVPRDKRRRDGGRFKPRIRKRLLRLKDILYIMLFSENDYRVMVDSLGRG